MEDVNDVVLKHLKQLIEDRDEQILTKLTELGYEFSNLNELVEFCETKCVLEHSFGITMLKVNSITVITWDDRFEFNWNPDNITITATLG